VRRNHIHHNGRIGIRLDWMTQGAHVTGNLLHDNISNRPGIMAAGADICMEAVHGHYLISDNILLSQLSLLISGQGGAFAHNLVAGIICVHDDDESKTPAFQAHSLVRAADIGNEPGDFRILNILVDTGVPDEIQASRKNQMSLPPSGALTGHKVPSEVAGNRKATGFRLAQIPDGWLLGFAADAPKRNLVTTESLGKAAATCLPFGNADGTPLRLDTDHFGKPRDKANPFPGSFETPIRGEIKVRPK
jgi:alpha-N-arabinofuranosidase